MSYDSATGIYRSLVPALPAEAFPNVSIDQFLFDRPVANPDAVWLTDALTGRSLSRVEVHERTKLFARAFRAGYGLGHDDVVVVFSGNEVDYPLALWATFKCGGIVSCANPAYMPDEFRYQIELVSKHHPIKIIITHPDSVVSALAAAKGCGIPETSVVLLCRPGAGASEEVKRVSAGFKSLDDLANSFAGHPIPESKKMAPGESQTKLAFLSFSSGTTGLPKAVAIPHMSVVANVIQWKGHWENTLPFTAYNPKTKKGDVVLGCLPFYHIYGLVVVLHTSVYHDVPVVTLNKFTFPSFLEAIQRHKITTLYVVPPMVIMMVKNDLVNKYDLSSLRVAMAGAAPLSQETSTALRLKFPKLTFGQGYGMTETCTIVTLFDPSNMDNIPAASAGVLVQNIDIKIVNPEGKFLPPGGVGEVLTRSPSNALGYLGNEKATKETFDDEGFVHTGDEAYIKDGWLYVVDRIKELIKCKGMQVAPAELEGLLLEHDCVLDVCVIGIPDDRAGERPKAYVALTPAALLRIKSNAGESDNIIKSIKEYVSTRKVDYKRLGEVEFIDAVPKTASGKLLRKDLRQLHAKTSAAAKARL
ncbi:hypothetical protein RQP46_009628 [Phenoliferia psychrophenolica]